MTYVDEGFGSIERMLAGLDMEFYLDREGIEYKNTHGSSGPQLNLRECPSCGGDKFKVYLNAENGLGNCFHGSCEARFNKYTFIKAHLDTEDFKVVRAHVGAALRDQGYRPSKQIEIKATDIEKQLCTLPISFALPINKRNLKYLTNRGISADIAEYFHLRWCENAFYYFEKTNGKSGWQDFSKRVIIPVFDLDGNLVTFQGRDTTETAEQKYLFPSGLPGTARFLYNGHNAIGASRVTMGEGSFDVMAIHIALAADENTADVGVVGSFGKHLSYGARDCRDQLGALMELKAKGLKEVTIMWDGEQPALMDAIKAALKIKSIGLVAKIALMPKGKDPNEVNPETVRRAYRQAIVITTKTATQLRIDSPYK